MVFSVCFNLELAFLTGSLWFKMQNPVEVTSKFSWKWIKGDLNRHLNARHPKSGIIQIQEIFVSGIQRRFENWTFCLAFDMVFKPWIRNTQQLNRIVQYECRICLVFRYPFKKITHNIRLLNNAPFKFESNY